MEIVAFVLLGIIIALGAFLLYREFINQISALTTRIEKLEDANHKRMPYKAQDDVLDAIAIVSDVLENNQDLNLLEKQRRAREERNLEIALNRLKEAMSVGTKREEK